MIVVDIGNTDIVIGIIINNKIKKKLRLKNEKNNLISDLNNFFNLKIINKFKIEYNTCIISSVSKMNEKIIINFFKKLKFKVTNINLNNIPKKIKFIYNFNELGADRIANTFAAINNYGKNSLVIDFGTATTFDLIQNNIYIGGLIAPGILNSQVSLVNSASKLNKVPIVKIKKIICNDTKSSMQSGFYWGYIGLINGIIERIMVEKKNIPIIILTGGLASIFKDEINYKTYIEPNLTLDGLYLIGQELYA